MKTKQRRCKGCGALERRFAIGYMDIGPNGYCSRCVNQALRLEQRAELFGKLRRAVG